MNLKTGWVANSETQIRRHRTWRLIWVYTICWSQSDRVLRVSTGVFFFLTCTCMDHLSPNWAKTCSVLQNCKLWNSSFINTWINTDFEMNSTRQTGSSQRAHNVETTSIQRWFNVLTLNRRCFNVVCLLGCFPCNWVATIKKSQENLKKKIKVW